MTTTKTATAVTLPFHLGVTNVLAGERIVGLVSRTDLVSFGPLRAPHLWHLVDSGRKLHVVDRAPMVAASGYKTQSEACHATGIRLTDGSYFWPRTGGYTSVLVQRSVDVYPCPDEAARQWALRRDLRIGRGGWVCYGTGETVEFGFGKVQGWSRLARAFGETGRLHGIDEGWYVA